MAGALIPSLLVTVYHTNLVAVAVNAITSTPVGIKLFNSPIWLSAALKVSALRNEAKRHITLNDNIIGS